MFTKTALIATLSMGLAAAASPGQDTQYVKQLYSDVVDHSANKSEVTKWATFLENGGARIQIAAALTSSQEYRTLFVDQVYTDDLHRAPTAAELNFWLAWMQQGATDDQVRAQVLASDEFYSKSGGTNQLLVTYMYQAILGTAIDQVTLASLGQLLTQGTPRATLATMLLTSVAGEQRKVEQWSLRFLRRNADPNMLASYAAAMQGGATDEQIIDLMLGSDAYFSVAKHGH